MGQGLYGKHRERFFLDLFCGSCLSQHIYYLEGTEGEILHQVVRPLGGAGSNRHNQIYDLYKSD